MKGILLCGHGSRSADGVAHFLEFSLRFKQKHSNIPVEIAFLELSEPNFAQSVDRLYQSGVRDIIAIPVFLFVGVHILEDIPAQLQLIAETYNDLSIRVANRIASSNAFSELLCNQLVSVSKNFNDEHLLVVGVGSSVNEANEDIHSVANYLFESMLYSSFSVAFVSPMAKPTVAQILCQLQQTIKDKRIIILPLILFSGVYFNKISSAISEYAMEDRCVVIDVLGNNMSLIDLLWQQAVDVDSSLLACSLDGSQLMGLDCCSGE